VIDMIEPNDAEEFLSLNRLALVGASDDAKSFSKTIYREMREHGHNVVAINPNATTVDGDPCYPDLASVPGDVDGVLVMVNKGKAADVVRAAAARGIANVWLFKGLGGEGAVSDEAIEVRRDNGMHVVAGACPLMFLEPVGWFHRAHRAVRHLNGSLAKG
jgi:predicted CoA-binding protein